MVNKQIALLMDIYNHHVIILDIKDVYGAKIFSSDELAYNKYKINYLKTRWRLARHQLTINMKIIFLQNTIQIE